MALRTRLLKVECLDCGYVARVTRKHLEARGAPLCPCNRQPMDAEEWEAYQRREQAALYATDTPTRTLRESWVHLRSAQACSRCGGELPHGEYAHHAVYTVAGEFVSEYTCSACHPETRSQYGRRALGYA